MYAVIYGPFMCIYAMWRIPSVSSQLVREVSRHGLDATQKPDSAVSMR